MFPQSGQFKSFDGMPETPPGFFDRPKRTPKPTPSPTPTATVKPTPTPTFSPTPSKKRISAQIGPIIGRGYNGGRP